MVPASRKEFLDIQANYRVWIHSEFRTWHYNNIQWIFLICQCEPNYSLMKVCVLNIRVICKKLWNRSRIYSFSTANGILMFLFEEDEPVNVVAHQQDLKDLFPDFFHYNSIMLGNFSLFTHPYGNEFFVFNTNRLPCLFRMCRRSRNPDSTELKLYVTMV